MAVRKISARSDTVFRPAIAVIDRMLAFGRPTGSRSLESRILIERGKRLLVKALLLGGGVGSEPKLLVDAMEVGLAQLVGQGEVPLGDLDLLQAEMLLNALRRRQAQASAPR